MDQKYIKLFRELTQAVATLSQQVIDYNNKNNQNKDNNAAENMRDQYKELHTKMVTPGFTIKELEKADYARLLIGAAIIKGNIADRIAAEQSAIKGYETDIIPKLQEIVDSKDEDKIPELAEKLFTISEDK